MARNIFLIYLALSVVLFTQVFANPVVLKRDDPIPNPAAIEREAGSGGRVSSQFDSFCGKFVASCMNTCLNGKNGIVTQSFYCAQVNPGANKKKYNFGCICAGADKTTRALNGVAGDKPSGPVTITDIISTTTQTDTSTASTQTLDPVTVFTTTTGTETLTSTMTVVATTNVGVTPVIVAQAEETDDILIVSVPNNAIIAKRAAAPSAFCSAFNDACDRQCTGVSSTTTSKVCKKTKTTSTGNLYKLYCKCANGNDRSHRALNDVDGTSTTTLSIVSTSTTTSLVTATLTPPAVTSTSTATSTVSTISKTTIKVLAPTGVIRVDTPNVVDGTSTGNSTVGYFHTPTGTWGGEPAVQADISTALKFALVQSTSKNYKNVYELVYANDPSIAIGGTSTTGSQVTCPGGFVGWIDEHPYQAKPGLSAQRDPNALYPGYYNNFLWQFAPVTGTPSGNWQMQMSPNWINSDGSFVPVSPGYQYDDPQNNSGEIYLTSCSATSQAALFFTNGV